MNGCVLGHYRDAAFPFEIKVVHNPFRDPFIIAKGSTLLQHGIDQSRLAVVHVSNNGNVANIFPSHEPSQTGTPPYFARFLLIHRELIGEIGWRPHFSGE
jgi:hypothetical protein